MNAKLVPLQGNVINHSLLNDPQQLRTVLDGADIPINYCSADKTFLFVNKTYAEWYGTTPEKIIGRSIEDLLGTEGEKTIRPYYERALRGEHLRYETEVNLSIGYRYIQVSYQPIYNNAVVTGWVGIIYDMTQRYLLEKALRENERALKFAKEKAEAANIAKSEFLTNMSHEIRTPMNAVLGLAHILNSSKPLTEKQQEYINTLQLSAQSLLTLINDLLDFSKLESNSIDLENLPFYFSNLIEEVISMFSIEVSKKGISISYEKSPDGEKVFLGDPLRIRQILTNLVGNAVKFTHEGGIAIQLSLTPSSGATQVYAHLGVKDTGVGIPANKVAIVFDKFMQADMSITRQYGGSGLGLAISKNLAELMGGSITLKSESGSGSEFILHLPLEYAKEAIGFTPLVAQEKDTSSEKSKIRILLAEDHQPNILVATTMLDILGYECDVARTGREVLVAITKDRSRYDIILMDVQMPELDGYITTRLIREDEQKHDLPRLPIIGMTAHVAQENINKCFDVGMDDYIGKPYQEKVLKEKINTLTLQKKALSTD